MIVANWKCNGSKTMLDEWISSYTNETVIKLDNSCIVAIAPPSIFFNELLHKINKKDLNICLCSQDIAGMSRKYTGAISSQLLIDANVDKFCIIDDLLATGGTAASVEELILSQNKSVTGLVVVVELLSLEGRKKFKSKVSSVIKF